MIISLLVEIMGYGLREAIAAFCAARPPGLCDAAYILALHRIYKLEAPASLPAPPPWRANKKEQRIQNGARHPEGGGGLGSWRGGGADGGGGGVRGRYDGGGGEEVGATDERERERERGMERERERERGGEEGRETDERERESERGGGGEREGGREGGRGQTDVGRLQSADQVSVFVLLYW
jgi:hypothetical protein